MDIEGVVYKILAPVKGTSARGEWTKQDVVLELTDEFSRKVCISFWGDKASDAAALKEGEHVNVSFNLESREYNGRWFTEVRAWKLQKQQPAAQQPQPMPDMPPVEESSYASEPADDLPF